MKLSYDPRHNIAYIRLREKTTQVETIRVSDELNVDLSPDGTVYGIELLNASARLRAADGGRLVVVDEAAGSETDVPLAGYPVQMNGCAFAGVPRYRAYFSLANPNSERRV